MNGRFLSVFRRARIAAHADAHATANHHSPAVTQLVHNVAASTISNAPPPASQASSVPTATATAATATADSDTTALFLDVYDCAKNNHNWNKVSSSVSNHPDWLTRIPQGLFL